jgi:hypothetical protein
MGIFDRTIFRTVSYKKMHVVQSMCVMYLQQYQVEIAI